MNGAKVNFERAFIAKGLQADMTLHTLFAGRGISG